LNTINLRQTTHVAVLDDYQGRAREFADWDALGAHVECSFFRQLIRADELAKTLRGMDVLVLMRERTAVPRSILEQLPELRLVVTTGMVNASLDVAYLAERGIPVSGTDSSPPADGVDSTAELAWALLLALTKRVTVEDRALRSGAWQVGLPSNLSGATLGLVGAGRLGTQMVRIAKVFGMRAIAWSPNLTDERAARAGAVRVSLDELCRRSDVISVHLVLSDTTRCLIGARELGLMKPSAFLVNTSRGPIVDESALADALETGAIAGAGLDVFSTEPLPVDSRFLRLENVVLTPHVGYVSEAGFRDMYRQVVEDIQAFLGGSPIRTLG
jgi:phosphoglycerate dehydrogenase-like enzyme